MAPKKTPTVDITAEVMAASKVLQPAVKRLAKSLQDLDPASLPQGGVSDLLYDLRHISKVLSALIAPFSDTVDPTIKAVEGHIIQTLAVGESSGVQGMKARVQVTERVIPTVEDWQKFYAYIAKTKSFDLLNRAPNAAAIGERWDAKKQVPGVGKFHAKRVSCTKLGGK